MNIFVCDRRRYGSSSGLKGIKWFELLPSCRSAERTLRSRWWARLTGTNWSVWFSPISAMLTENCCGVCWTIRTRVALVAGTHTLTHMLTHSSTSLYVNFLRHPWPWPKLNSNLNFKCLNAQTVKLRGLAKILTLPPHYPHKNVLTLLLEWGFWYSISVLSTAPATFSKRLFTGTFTGPKSLSLLENTTLLALEILLGGVWCFLGTNWLNLEQDVSHHKRNISLASISMKTNAQSRNTEAACLLWYFLVSQHAFYHFFTH